MGCRFRDFWQNKQSIFDTSFKKCASRKTVTLVLDVKTVNLTNFGVAKHEIGGPSSKETPPVHEKRHHSNRRHTVHTTQFSHCETRLETAPDVLSRKPRYVASRSFAPGKALTCLPQPRPCLACLTGQNLAAARQACLGHLTSSSVMTHRSIHLICGAVMPFIEPCCGALTRARRERRTMRRIGRRRGGEGRGGGWPRRLSGAQRELISKMHGHCPRWV